MKSCDLSDKDLQNATPEEKHEQSRYGLKMFREIYINEKGQQHAKLKQALRLCGHDVTSSTFICGSTGSQNHSNNDTIRMLGIEH